MDNLAALAELDRLREQLRHLQACTMIPGCWDKRFVADTFQKDPAKLTENQRNQVRRLAYKYRRQMPAQLVPNRTNLPRGVVK
jgi:hypothetical protein